MQHFDLDDLAMFATGAVPSPLIAAHVRDCAECTAELEALRSTITALRSAPASELLIEPPPEVWAGIRAELGLAAQSDTEASESDTPQNEHGSPPNAVVPQDETKVVLPGNLPGERHLTGRRSRRVRASFALAASAALLGAAAGSGITWWAINGQEAPPVAGTSRTLEPLIPAALGSARMGEAAGQRKLDIKVEGLPKTSGYFEVWLMDRGHKKLISMGVLGQDGHAVLPVPENVNLGEYAIVDVSVQEYNGSPDHSGKSIVRGEFATTASG